MFADAPTTSTPRERDRSDTVRRFAAWTVARNLHVLLGALLVVAVAAQQNFSDVRSTQFHPDESRWLNRARYLEDLRHPFSSAWEDRYLTEGQPPGGSYVTAIGLLAQGHDLDTNGPWNFSYGSASYTWWNVSRGAMPASADLLAARRTSALLGVVSALALFLIVTRMANVLGGIVAGVFFAIHPLSVYLSTLAVSDAAFTFFIAIATLAAMGLARRPTWRRAILLGVTLGAGASTKLTPLFLAAGLAVIGAGLVLLPYACRWPLVGRAARRVPVGDGELASPLGWKLLAQPVFTTFLFVLSYPFLWPDPLGRTRMLFDFRRAEMNNQARIWPEVSVDSRLEALRRAWTMLEDRYSASGKVAGGIAGMFGRDVSERGVDLPFVLVGLAILAVLTWRRGIASPTFIGLAVAGGQAAMIVAGLRVDFDRYYLPIVFLSGIGIGTFGGGVWSLGRHRFVKTAGRRALPRRPALSLRPQPATGQTSAD